MCRRLTTPPWPKPCFALASSQHRGANPMALVQKTYGKDRVRIMRINKSPDRHEVRELTVRAMMTGAFDKAFTEADNSNSAATDTVKNICNVVARENMTLNTEQYCAAVAEKLLSLYP